jgi:outer membrane protein OmpA-like peptidoglycan-associated protein
MEKLLMDHLEITDEELRSLAQERANRVRDYILSSGEIDPERIFIVEPKIYPPGEDEKVKNSRVQFALK